MNLLIPEAGLISVSPTILTPIIDKKTAMRTANTLSGGGMIVPKKTCIKAIHAISEREQT